ncbi:FAD-dependent oxidoreductase [Mycobacterium sp. DL440]|uniref:oxidoreductase n=1 Tax=Mycobacterium sp. DL440 TaxID=2675523 RepID=UPI00141DF3A5|nr:FAD-dependent oxidoreductase [Mycobacterium sp. DL440]
MRDPMYDILFEQVQIGPKRTKNRFYQAPHSTGLGMDRIESQVRYRGIKAEGGWGVVNTEYCSIHPETGGAPPRGMNMWDDNDMKNHAHVVDAIHEHDALAGIELWYPGASFATPGLESRMSARSASSIRAGASSMGLTREMDRAEIRELQSFFVAAARRARDVGYDLINLNSAEVATIFESFLMEHFNRRTDEYGGSLENRARFGVETLEMVREAVGDDCGIVMRLCVDSGDGTGKGLRPHEDAGPFISLADHAVDLWDLQVGGWKGPWPEDAGSSRFFEENFQGVPVAAMRPYTKKPIAGVGRLTSPDLMVKLIKNGQLDLIGGSRPSIADPFLPRKIEEGRHGDIRECIGCNMCVARLSQSAAIICTQNATIGEEHRRGWHPEKFTRASNADKNVLIVGAGPAGMECAIVLGKRGMNQVHLVDAGSEVGGGMHAIGALPRLSEWRRVIDWRAIQIESLENVEFIGSTTLDAKAIRDYGADIVVIATGADWATDGSNGFTMESLPGADAQLPHVLTPEQILAGKQVPGDNVLIYDCDGFFTATSLAEKLAMEGKNVRLVSASPSIAPYGAYTVESDEILKRFAELGVELVTSRVLVSVEPGRAVAARTFDLNLTPTDEWAMDAVVLVTRRIPNDSLYQELHSLGQDTLAEDGITGLYRIGESVAPRHIADAIFDGHRLAQEIDGANPAVPLPYHREQLVLHSAN